MAEPITLSEAKLYMRIDDDYTYDDTLIQSLIVSNRQYLEKELGLSLVPKTGLKYKSIRPCCGQISTTYLPYGPVNNIVGTRISDNVIIELDNLSSDDEYPMYRLTNSTSFTYDAGTWAEFPEAIKSALKALVADQYDNRETYIIGDTVNPILQSQLLPAYKYSRNLYLS